MKRRWHPVRLFFAGVLLCLAGFVYACWPVHHRWKVPHQYCSVLGFCPKGNVLLVAPLIANDTLNRLNESAKDLSQPVSAIPDPDSFQLIGLNLDDGSQAFAHKVPFVGRRPIPIMAIADGQFVAFDEQELGRIKVLNTLTGQVIAQLDTPGIQEGYQTRQFSNDGRLFAIAYESKVQVWNLEGMPRLQEVEIKSLELAQFMDLHRQEIVPLQAMMYRALSWSRDNRYLAFAMNNVVTVFEANTMQIIGQGASQGVPQFLSDGTLAMILLDDRALKPLAALFHIEYGQLSRIVNDQKNDPVNHRAVARNSETYASIQIIHSDWRLPDWTPKWILSKAYEWFSFMKDQWAVSLRDLTTGKELVQRRFVHEPTGGPISSGMLMAMSEKNYVPNFPYYVTLSPDHRLMALYDSTFIELWPLLTWWRPWYCWATILLIVGLTGWVACPKKGS
ncbi:MAG: hypothetical protein QM703_18455 [Gemmatales bacterium]